MAEHDIRFADYDDGRPDHEKKNSLFMRNRSGDNRVALLGLAFFVIPLVLGGIFAIPAVQDFREGRQNLAEIAFGADSFNDDGLGRCAFREIRIADLHAAKDLTNATALEITILVQTRSKGTVARASKTVSLDGVDLESPSLLDHGITQDDLVSTSPDSAPAVCGYEVEIVR